MPAGKHRQKLRRIARRLEAVLEEEREKEQPTPPPINEEHALLRKRMEEASKIVRDAENSEAFDPATGIIDSPDARRAAVRSIQLMYEEQKLLEAHGLDPGPYQPS